MTFAAVAANLGGVALVVLPGLGLAELFAPLRRLPFLRRLGYSYLLGLLMLGGALFAASHLFGLPLRRPAILAAALAPAASGLVARLRRQGQDHRQASRWQIAAALCIAAICLGPLTSALTAPLGDWDGRMTWSPLAAYMRHEGTVDASVLREDQWWILHPRYPPLLPLAQVAAQEMFGAGEDDQFYRALYAAFLPALLLVLYDGARRAAGTRAAVLATLGVAVLPFLSYGAGGATSAYSDLPLAGFYGAALILLLLERTRPSAGLAAGCLLAGAILTKNEGALLAVAAMLLASLRLLRRPRALGWFACAAGPALAAFALLTSWRAAIPNRDDENYFAVLRLSDLLNGAVARLPVIVPEILRWTFRWSSWLGFWLLFLVVLIAGCRALRRPGARLLLLAGWIPGAIGWAAYAVSTRLGHLLGETWDRFLLQGLVPLAIVFACALKKTLAHRVDFADPRAQMAEKQK
ncbi:MAG TPA: glycosyltransferase family 39 protein [Thermoanaerobaculia bacterium]|nr:glycosyltransferase family 39 protein [Thermoanaerobaculia bacterium]